MAGRVMGVCRMRGVGWVREVAGVAVTACYGRPALLHSSRRRPRDGEAWEGLPAHPAQPRLQTSPASPCPSLALPALARDRLLFVPSALLAGSVSG